MVNSSIQSFIDKAAAVSTLGDTSVLHAPKRTLQFTFPVIMDDGSIRHFQGYRVQYNDARGPFKGGLRFHHEVDLEEVEMLSFLMALKCATVNIPLGGGKGGVTVNAKELSKGELERLSKAFMRELAHFIGPDVDIPAPDVNTTPTIMGWMTEEYERMVGKKAPGVITGKPLQLGGSQGRNEATSRGGYIIIEELLKRLQKEKLTVAIQGFGNVGGFLAQMLEASGHTIVAVSNSQGGIFKGDGLQVDEALRLYKGRDLQSYAGATAITNDELLELDVDLLIPSALGDVITAKNVNNIKAGIILEMANGPITVEADEVLDNKGVIVVPDILANAGGVTVSYFEWVQNRMQHYWDAEYVDAELQKIMRPAFGDVWDKAQEKKISMRQASFVIAIERILEAEKLRGNLTESQIKA